MAAKVVLEWYASNPLPVSRIGANIYVNNDRLRYTEKSFLTFCPVPMSEAQEDDSGELYKRGTPYWFR